jgi:hypothetical protein
MFTVLPVKYIYVYRLLTYFEFSRSALQKVTDIKCYENPPSGNRIVARERADGLTGGNDEDNSCFLQFR